MSEKQIISILFCAVGAAPVAIGIHLLRKFRRYAAFPSTEAVILKNEIITAVEPETGGRHEFIPQLTFTYTLDGRIFTTDKLFSFSRSHLPRFRSRQRAGKIVDGFPVGSSTRIQYDPADPAFSFIRNGPLLQIRAPFLIGIAFFVFALLYQF